MVHIRVTQTWRQRFAEHEPSGAHAADESCRAVNPFRVQETSSIFQLPGHVPDPLGKGGQVRHHLVVEQLSGGCGLEIGATQSLLRASVVRKHHLLMVDVDDSCTPPRTPSLQLCRWCAQSAFSNLAIRRWAPVPRRFRRPVFSVGPSRANHPPAVFHPPRTPSLSRSGLGKD